MSEERLEIDIFSDPVCPWCLLGLNRLDKVVKALPADIVVELRHHPFLLDANAPVEGENIVEMLTRKYGRAPTDSWDRLEAEAKTIGLDLDMRKQDMRYPSQAALVLIAAAREKGTQHKLALAVGHAYYIDALNISDPEVLVSIGTRFGFTAEEVRVLVTDAGAKSAVESAAAQASAQGISGVPFFIFGNKYALSGAQPVDMFEKAIAAARNEAAGNG